MTPAPDASGRRANLVRIRLVYVETMDSYRAADGPAGDPPVVCTLGDDEMPGRVAEWRAALAAATAREETAGGVRLRFHRATDVAALAGLAAAENECCRWATFTITIGPDEVTMDVTGSAAARPSIVALYAN